MENKLVMQTTLYDFDIFQRFDQCFSLFRFFHRNSVYCQGVKRRDETTFPTLTCARRLKCE